MIIEQNVASKANKFKASSYTTHPVNTYIR